MLHPGGTGQGLSPQSLWINHISSHGTLVSSRSLALLGISAGQPLLTGNDNQRGPQLFFSFIGAQERERAILAAAELAASGA